MPSTEYFGYTITNVGPLTTTFTAPSSCSTATDFYVIAPKDDWSTAIYGRPDCERPTLGKCFASGEAGDEIAKSAYESLGQGFIPYFSPGLHCPAGWTTVGTVAHAGKADSTSLDSEGFFTNDLNPFDDSTDPRAAFLPVATLLVDALAPSETLVWCCPTGHTANVYGACLSSVGPRSSFSYSEACVLLLPPDEVATVTSFDGSVWDPPLLTVEGDGTSLETARVTLDDDSLSDAVVVNSVPAVIMVHQPTDTSDNGGDGGDEGDKGGSGEDDGDGASSLRALSLVPMAAVVVGLLTGIGILAPW